MYIVYLSLVLFTPLIFLSFQVKEVERKDEVEWRLMEVEELVEQMMRRVKKERMMDEVKSWWAVEENRRRRRKMDFWWSFVAELQPSRSLQDTTQPFTYLSKSF